MDVEFDPIRSERGGRSERLQGVAGWMESRSSAVRDDEGHRA
jgi:hypothetical protein